MEIIYIKLGDHYIQINNKSKEFTEYFSQNYFLISKNCIPKIDLRIEISKYNCSGFKDFNVLISEIDGIVKYERADYIISTRSDFTFAKIQVYDEYSLKHALVNLYSSYIVQNNWGIILHSSCVVDKENAHIFTGFSGAGKSTAARLSQPRELLSDDTSILKITETGVLIYNSPFRSDILASREEKIISLGSIQLIHQSIDNGRKEISKTESLTYILDNTFFWHHLNGGTIKLFNLLGKLANQVPMYHLYFQKNNSFWELIS